MYIIREKIAIMINGRGNNVLNWSISKFSDISKVSQYQIVSDTIQSCINQNWNKVPIWNYYGHELKTSLICVH